MFESNQHKLKAKLAAAKVEARLKQKQIVKESKAWIAALVSAITAAALTALSATLV